jgi:hypothetical protein
MSLLQNRVWGNSGCLLRESYGTRIQCAGCMQRFNALKEEVYIVTTELSRVTPWNKFLSTVREIRTQYSIGHEVHQPPLHPQEMLLALLQLQDQGN